MPGPYALTTHDGKRVDMLTKAALLDAEAVLGYDLTITQGSYNAGGVGASAGTHDRGGVVDLTGYQADRKVQVLRSLGFAAWHRTPAQGPWPAHVHAVLIGHRRLAPSAERQAQAYLAGRNGLASNGTDDGPRGYVRRRYRWRRGARRISRARQLIEQAHAQLAGTRGYGGKVPPLRRRLREVLRGLPE